jgi:hypothetical protein
MGVHLHLIEHRFLGSVACLIAALINVVDKRFRFSIPEWSYRPFVHRMMFGCRRGCLLIALICLTLAWPPIALSQEIDEGEFSQAMLGHKLQLLKAQFEQTERKLSTRSVAGTTLKKLEHVYSEIKRLEAEFRWGRYYPDLLDEQIVIIREELRLIPADPVETGSTSQPGSL